MKFTGLNQSILEAGHDLANWHRTYDSEHSSSPRIVRDARFLMRIAGAIMTGVITPEVSEVEAERWRRNVTESGYAAALVDLMDVGQYLPARVSTAEDVMKRGVVDPGMRFARFMVNRKISGQERHLSRRAAPVMTLSDNDLIVLAYPTGNGQKKPLSVATTVELEGSLSIGLSSDAIYPAAAQGILDIVNGNELPPLNQDENLKALQALPRNTF